MVNGFWTILLYHVEVVSRLMGHANIMVTYNKYIHVIKEQEAKAMKLHMVI